VAEQRDGLEAVFQSVRDLPIPLRQRPPMIAGLDFEVPQRHFDEGIQTLRPAGEQKYAEKMVCG
jgi:hypothetical protein